jgi:ParB family transcriptional regulator, chromosome partitioning protein
METKKKALGKGLEQLFNNSAIDFDNFESSIVENNQKNVTEINLSEIRSNPYQPRKTFNEDSLNELAESIKEYGVVQPIIVKKSIKGYELIAGERRCKAATKAGLTKIPAIIKDFSDQEMMEIALLENIQREDLNPIDEANSVESIIKLRGFTQEEFAAKFGKSRSYVTNLLGILKLPVSVKKLVENGSLSMSHARVLSKIDDEEKIISLAEKIIKENLSVREVEKLANKQVTIKEIKENKLTNMAKYKMFQDIMCDKLGTNVKITKNKIEINFINDEDLEKILETLNIKIEDE